MSSVDRVGLRTQMPYGASYTQAQSNKNNSTIQHNQVSYDSGKKSGKVKAANIALGSLAAIGVLSMADILICKGKHINKITGGGKELQAAVDRAAAAEAKVQQLAAAHADDTKTIEELTKKNADLKADVTKLIAQIQKFLKK